jgi:hypothetical protein
MPNLLSCMLGANKIRDRMLADIPWIIFLIIVTIFLLGILAVFSNRWETNDPSGSKRWARGWRMMEGLIVLDLVAFIALVVVSLFGP